MIKASISALPLLGIYEVSMYTYVYGLCAPTTTSKTICMHHAAGTRRALLHTYISPLPHMRLL